MLSISTIGYDVAGSLLIEELPGSKIYDAKARVSRYATLDSGVVIDHQGYVAGDRTLRIKASLSESEEEILKNMFENETLIHITLRDGLYTGAIESVSGDNGQVEISILLKEAV